MCTSIYREINVCVYEYKCMYAKSISFSLTLFMLNNIMNMDLIMCTSRGRGLEEAMLTLPENPLLNTHFIVRPGAQIRRLADEAHDIILKSPISSHCIIVYFIAGLCDITQKISDHHYQEIIFNDSFPEAPTRIMPLFTAASNTILNTGATPCFTTITPMHLQTWNTHRLNTHRTNYLLHHQHYDSMQSNLIKATAEINQHITEINITNNIQTPRLAQHTLYKPGAHSTTHRFRYHLLPDGVHLNNNLKQKWAQTLAETISINRINSSPASIQLFRL